MQNNKVINYIKGIIKNIPDEWLTKTTHRLDIYNESKAKVEFLEQFEELYSKEDITSLSLSSLPTSYDYIRLGHPLSCILEWVIAKNKSMSSKNVISFSSKIMPILAVLRQNSLDGIKTQIAFINNLSPEFNVDILKEVYGYKFELIKVNNINEIPKNEAKTIFVTNQEDLLEGSLSEAIDFYVGIYAQLGSVVLINGESNKSYISSIQHVRRRETIAMTPSDCLSFLNILTGGEDSIIEGEEPKDKQVVIEALKSITGTQTNALLGTSGLSVQYAILMGLVHSATEQNPGKEIKIIVPPNCYGGTNDQARRVAACIGNVEVVDLPVDSGSNMVQSVEAVLNKISVDDAVPLIIAEIPTNPRVEVPDLEQLKEALLKPRKTKDGSLAVEPIFILDQTFCPNVQFLPEGKFLSGVKTITYVSGSKFPSGGKCTVGYCVANKKAEPLLKYIDLHLSLCDNGATPLQVNILSKQLPSMNQRISEAYKNTRSFVNHIREVLPTAKINFVSESLAEQGFTPSVFSLDLPTKGNSPAEKEEHKRELNYKLINLMIENISEESKHCVSYGQLKGCYWTIPAT